MITVEKLEKGTYFDDTSVRRCLYWLERLIY